MRLVITTPTALVDDISDITHIRAEDETGAFGIMPGHADFVTVLPVSVVVWKDRSGREGFVLVREGVLSVRGGQLVEIAARGAIRENELGELNEAVLQQLRETEEEEALSRKTETRLHLATIRRIERVLHASGQSQSQLPSLRRSEQVGEDLGAEGLP